MSWTGDVRYQTSFRNRVGEMIDVYIFERGYSGPPDTSTLKLYDPGVEIEQPPKDIFEPVRGKNCKLYLKEEKKLDLAFLFNKPPNYYKVKVLIQLVDNLFEGFLQTDIYYSNLSPYDREVIVTATNNLALTKHYTPGNYSLGNPAPTLLEVIDDILWSTELDYAPIFVNCNLFEQGHDPSGRTLFDQTYVDPEVFLKNNLDNKDGLTILNDLLKPFNCWLYAGNNDWRIERFKDYYNPDASVRWIRYENVNRLGAFSRSTVMDKKRLIDLPTTYKILTDDQELEKTNAVNIYKMERPANTKRNLVNLAGAEFIVDQSAGTAPLNIDYGDWKKSQSIVNFTYTPFQFNYTFNVITYTVGTDHLATRTRLTFNLDTSNNVSAADNLIISFESLGNLNKTRTPSGGTVGTYYVPVMVRIVNNVWPTGRYVYADLNDDNKLKVDGAVRYTFAKIDHEVNATPLGVSLVDWGFKGASITMNLSEIRQHLEGTNWLDIGFTIFRTNPSVTDAQVFDRCHPDNYIRNLNVTVRSQKLEENLIEANANIGYRDVYEDEILLGDLNNFNYFNGFLRDPDYIAKTRSWGDGSEPSTFLENKLLLDRMQQLNKNRYKLTVGMKDVSIWRRDSIFSYSLLNAVDPSMRFIPVGYNHDAYNCETTLYLEEYKPYDGLSLA